MQPIIQNNLNQCNSIPMKDTGVSFGVIIYPPLSEGGLHFCGFGCLKGWLKCKN